jgi:parvulin-like peptidyl-prolyl isomerase
MLLAIAQAQDKQVLAKIGQLTISTEEFQLRYELTPQMFRENQRISEESKLEFLYSMIAEKLLALYGDEIRLDTSLIVSKSLKYFEEMFVRDALYKKVIEEKAQFKTDSLMNFYLSNANNVKMIFIFSDDENEIKNIYKILGLGVPFDSLYSELPVSQRDTLTISVGELEEKIENEIFPLPDDAFTIPIEMEDGWYIFKILKRYNPIVVKSEGWENDFKNSKRLAKERAEYSFYKEYMQNLFKNKEVKINAKILRNLSYHIYSILVERFNQTQSSKNHSLTATDIAFIEFQLGVDSLILPLAELENETITVRDYLHFLRFDNFKVDTLNYQFVFKALSNKTKNFIEYKILSEQGYKLGLQKTTEVKKQVQMWKDNYYMQLVTAMFIDSAAVSDNEIIEYYNKSKNGYLQNKEVNILELVTDSLETIEKVLSGIELGTDFYELVKKYSKDFSDDSKGMESGFFSVNSNGDVGRIAADMNIGEVYGPIKISEGYLIFKLLAVRQDSVILQDNFKQIKKELGKELGYLKKQKSINKFIGNLANKYDVDINTDLLEKISVTSHNSIVYDYLGFGGRVLAVPLININMEWVPEWKENIEKIQ